MDISDQDLCWLAGYLEGEGSFCKSSPSKPNTPFVCVSSTDEDVISRVSDMFGVTYHKVTKNKDMPHWKQAWATRKSGYAAVILMKMLKPMMSTRRQQQITTAIASYTETRHKLTPKERVEVKEMADLGEKTQAEIARIFGITRERVNKIKNGKANWKNRSTMVVEV